MERDAVITRLKHLEPRLRRVGVAGLYLFGSVAGDEARAESDVDLFIHKDDPQSFGFNELMEVYDILQDAVPQEKLSYTTREGLVDVYRAEIEASCIRVF